MGFWHTGYLDKLDTGYNGYKFEYKPKVYLCPQCNAEFPSQDELLQHRFQEHPFHRPTLLLRGEELPSSRKTITREISAEDVVVAGCDRVLVDNRAVTPGKLGAYLAKSQKGIKLIILENRDITTEYELQFIIPQPEEMQEIDRRFFEITANGVLTKRDIDNISEFSKVTKTAVRYLDGIIQYLYGILTKDQKGGSCLEIGQYKEKYNQALDALHDFHTPLARIICGIVNFNLNVFSIYPSLNEAPSLQASMYFFQKCLFRKMTKPDFATFPDKSLSGDKIPLDSFTDRIIAWSLADDAELEPTMKYIVSQSQGIAFPPDDQFKLRVLAAEYAHRNGNHDLVRDLVRPVVNDALYGGWAENLLDSIE